MFITRIPTLFSLHSALLMRYRRWLHNRRDWLGLAVVDGGDAAGGGGSEGGAGLSGGL